MNTYDLDTATLTLIAEEDSADIRRELSPGFLKSYNAAYGRLVRERARPQATATARLASGALDMKGVAGAGELVAVRARADGPELPLEPLGGGRYRVGGVDPGAQVTVEYVKTAPALTNADPTTPTGTHGTPDLLAEAAQMALAHWAAYVYLSSARRYSAAAAQLELYRAAADIPRGGAPGLTRLRGLYAGEG